MRVLVLLPILAIAAACTAGGGAAVPPSSPTAAPASATPAPSPSENPDAALLRVERIGGFLMPNTPLVQWPSLVIYADGRVFEQGAVTMEYPGRLVPPTLVSKLTPAGVAAVRAAIDAAGLSSGTYPAHGIADAPNLSVTALTASGPVTAVLGAAGPEASFAPDEARLRAAVDKLLAQTGNLQALVGAANVSAAAPYTPTALRVLLTPGAKPDDGMNPQPLAWPLKTSIAKFGSTDGLIGDARCAAVEGADAASLWGVLAEARQNQYFVDGGTVYLPQARPLLPGEPLNCAIGG